MLAAAGLQPAGFRRSGAVMLKLFFSPQSCALASHIALEEAAPIYEAVRVDFSKERAARAPSISRSTRRAACRRWRPIAAF